MNDQKSVINHMQGLDEKKTKLEDEMRSLPIEMLIRFMLSLTVVALIWWLLQLPSDYKSCAAIVTMVISAFYIGLKGNKIMKELENCCQEQNILTNTNVYDFVEDFVNMAKDIPLEDKSIYVNLFYELVKKEITTKIVKDLIASNIKNMHLLKDAENAFDNKTYESSVKELYEILSNQKINQKAF